MGRKSKNAVIHKLSSKQKDKVLKDYYYLINKNRKLIINEISAEDLLIIF